MKYLSVFDSDEKVLTAFSDIFLKGKWFDLDCTYSKGVFYKNTKQPNLKSDLYPLFDDVVEADSQSLSHISDDSLESIVFDPPFLFRNRRSPNVDKISSRFSFFPTFDKLEKMYKNSLDCFFKKLKNHGYVFFKCQDMTDGKFYCTHNLIINHAIEIGFEIKDIAIKQSKGKLQRDAVQQNCVAKTHSFWIAFRKKSNPYVDKVINRMDGLYHK